MDSKVDSMVESSTDGSAHERTGTRPDVAGGLDERRAHAPGVKEARSSAPNMPAQLEERVR
jgi:hypothetical protein